MEIIAKTEIGYLVDIEKSELEMLTGFYYGNSSFSIGKIIKVDSLYHQLTALGKQGDEIKKISHTLKTAAGMLEKIDPVFYEEKKV
jgi:hypothetical protein